MRRKSLLIISLEKAEQEVARLREELKRSHRDNQALKEMLVYTEENHTIFERSRLDNETLKEMLVRTNENHTAFELSFTKVMEYVEKETKRAERIIAGREESKKQQTDFAIKIGLFPESKKRS